MGKSTESIIRPALVLMSGRALGFLAAFLIPIVLVRIFDQSEFGTYKQLFLIYGTLFGICQLGLAESLYFFLPSDARRAGAYVRNAIFVLGVSGVVCMIALWTQRSGIAGLLNNEYLSDHIFLIAVFLMLMLMSVVLEIVMTARKQNLSASVAYALSDLLRAVLCVLPALWFGVLRWLLIGVVVFAGCRLAATIFYLRYEFRDGFRPDAGLMKKHLAYALPFGLAAIIEIMQANLHMYAVSYHFDAATFAIYAVGCFQIPMIDYLMTSTSNVLMVNMREKLVQGKMAVVLEMWRDTTRKLVLIFCLIVGGLLAIAHELIVLLFTSDYQQSVPVFMIWTLAMVFAGFLTDGVLRVYAENRFLILLNSIKLILVVATINWFLMRFDLLGAVFVTLLVAFIAKLIALVRVKMLMQCDLSRFLPWRSLGQILAITVVAVFTALLIKAISGLSGVPALVTAGMVYTVVYSGLLVILGPLSEQEKLELLGYVQTPVSRLCRNWKV